MVEKLFRLPTHRLLEEGNLDRRCSRESRRIVYEIPNLSICVTLKFRIHLLVHANGITIFTLISRRQ